MRELAREVRQRPGGFSGRGVSGENGDDCTVVDDKCKFCDIYVWRDRIEAADRKVKAEVADTEHVFVKSEAKDWYVQTLACRIHALIGVRVTTTQRRGSR